MLLSSSRRLLHPNLRFFVPKRAFSTPSEFNSTFEYPPLKPPSAVDDDMALGVQDAVDLLIRKGIGRQRLLSLSTAKMPTVQKWQGMMECYLATQVHVLAGLGYSADEAGLSSYHQHLGQFLQTSAKIDTQELYREASRDTWRVVLATAFDLDPDDIEEKDTTEARDIMHKVSTKMQSEGILQIVAKKCASLPKVEGPLDEAQRHHIVQQVMVNDVYLGGDPPFIEDFGFGKGEKGYVRMQMSMADHQNDPLVAQYIGSGMLQILTAAGINMGSMRQTATKLKDGK